MSLELEKYDEFEQRLKERFPEMFARPYGGIACGEGWWSIIESLCSNIQHHINSRKKHNEWCVKNEKEVSPEIPQVVVAQIKEKFGGLRFYYDGGDDIIDGMVRMAESWAEASCEDCGNRATKKTSGWIKNVCDVHYEQREQARKARFADE